MKKHILLMLMGILISGAIFSQTLTSEKPKTGEKRKPGQKEYLFYSQADKDQKIAHSEARIKKIELELKKDLEEYEKVNVRRALARENERLQMIKKGTVRTDLPPDEADKEQ